MTALILTLVAAFIHVIPGAAELLQWTQADGHAATLWTAHLAHWSTGHFLWDALMFAALGVFAQRRYGLNVCAAFLCAAPLITLGVARWSPELTSYRGLSGLDTLLFVFVCVRLLCDAKQMPGLRIASVLLMTGLAGKTFYETATGGALFAQDLGPGVVAAPVAHLVGGALGLMIALWPTARAYARRLRRRMATPSATAAKSSA